MPSIRRLFSEVGAAIAFTGIIYIYFKFPYSDYIGTGSVILGLSLIYIGLNIIRSSEVKQEGKKKVLVGSGGGCPFSGNSGTDGTACPFSSSGKGKVALKEQKAAAVACAKGRGILTILFI